MMVPRLPLVAAAARRSRSRRAGGSAYDTRPLNVVFEGDSITYGGQHDVPVHGGYPEQAMADPALAEWDITIAGNLGVSFASMPDVISRAASQDALIDPTKRNVITLLIGANDVAALHSAATIYADIVSWRDARLAAGYDAVMVCTMLSRGAGAYNSIGRQLRELILAGESYTVDWGLDPLIGTVFQPYPANANVALFPDNLHPNMAGCAIMLPYYISGFYKAAGRPYPALASIEVSSNLADIGVGGRQTFTAKCFDSFDIPIPAPGAVVWSSSNPAIATIDPVTGVMIGVAVGNVTITATIGAVSGNTSADVVAFSLPRHIATTHLWTRVSLEPYSVDDEVMEGLFDRGGNEYHATGELTKLRAALINGKNTCHFDGNTRAHFADVLSGLTEGEMFYVGTYAGFMTWVLGSSGLDDFLGLGGNVHDSFGSTTRHSAGALGVAADTPFIYNVISTPTEFTINVNGVQLFTTAVNTVGWPAAPLLGGSVTPFGGTGEIGDFFISFAKLSAPDRALVLNEMATFYGIAV